MLNNPELAGRLQKIYDYLCDDNLIATYDAMKQLKEIIYELNPPMFPDPIDGIKIEYVSYLPGYEPKNYEEERRFAISKTEKTKPHEVIDARTGKRKISTTITYVLAYLKWDGHEEGFRLESVGTRWLEAAPSKEVCDMILKFCTRMEEKYDEEDG